MSDSFKITHLYPKHMSMYGDRGNALVLSKIALQYGLKSEIIDCNPGDVIDAETKVLLIGGGQDLDQEHILKDLFSKKDEINSLLINGATLLCICGGYQLIGEYYKYDASNYLDCLKIIKSKTQKGNLYSKNSNLSRFIGNIKCKSNILGELYGFENHSGLTFLDEAHNALALVTEGNGNNGQDKTEGYYNEKEKGLIIATYMHSFLAKNTHVAHQIIKRYTSFRQAYYLDPLETLNRFVLSTIKY